MLTAAICITLNNSMISKTYFPHILFKHYSLVEVAYLFFRCDKTKFFLWNTNNTDRNGVDKQNLNTHTHTHTRTHTTKDKAVWSYLLAWQLLNFSFFTVKKKQLKNSALFWTWDSSLNKNKLFLRNITC